MAAESLEDFLLGLSDIELLTIGAFSCIDHVVIVDSGFIVQCVYSDAGVYVGYGWSSRE